jgi:hypothetical protein
MWSLLNGFFAVVFGIFETARFLAKNVNRSVDRAEYVTDIWRERTDLELCSYLLGQLFFITLPLVALLASGNKTWATYLFVCPIGFTFLTVVTLFLPIGARRRYRWLITRQETGYERLFLGLMPPHLLLSASGDGLRACLFEELGYLFLIIVGAAVTQLALFGVLPGEFHPDSGAALPEFSAGLFVQFLYMSVGSLLTSEYASLAPWGTYSQAIATGEVLVGSVYLFAIIPTLVAVIVERRPGSNGGVPNPAVRSDAIRSALGGASKWLEREQRHGTHWNGDSPPDLVANSLAATFLKTNVSTPRNAEAWRTFDAVATGLAARRGRDPLGKLVFRIVQNGISEPQILRQLENLRSKSEAHEHQPMLAALLIIALGTLPLMQVRRYLASNLDRWAGDYGPHWECYALLAQLFVAQLPTGGTLQPSELTVDAKVLANRLLGRRANNGSWYEDVILTSLVGIAFARLGLLSVPLDDAAIWLAREIRKRPAGLSLVSGLPVWGTAWATQALQDYLPDSKVVRRSLTWLVGRATVSGVEGEWSWSTGLSLTCYDTSSTVCEVLHAAEIKDVRLASAMEAGLRTLGLVRNQYRYPTFAPAGVAIHYCPIISARVTSLLQERAGHVLAEGEAILANVVNHNWISEWFSDPAISRGLVLSYLGSFCKPSLRTAKLLTESVAKEAPTSMEGAAAMILGLHAAQRNLHLSVRTRARCERQNRFLVDYLIGRRSEHHWVGDKVGVFGFGRLYADPVFATAIALRALATQS